MYARRQGHGQACVRCLPEADGPSIALPGPRLIRRAGRIPLDDNRRANVDPVGIDLELHRGQAIVAARVSRGNGEAERDGDWIGASIDEHVIRKWTCNACKSGCKVEAPVGVARAWYTSERAVDQHVVRYERIRRGRCPHYRRRTGTIRIPRPAITRFHPRHAAIRRARRLRDDRKTKCPIQTLELKRHEVPARLVARDAGTTSTCESARCMRSILWCVRRSAARQTSGFQSSRAASRLAAQNAANARRTRANSPRRRTLDRALHPH